RRTATPAVAICMLLAGMVAFDGFCAFHAGHPAMTLAIGLALLFAGGRDPYKMRIRALRDRYAKPAPYPPPAHGAARELVDLRRTIEQSGNSRPLVLVCASGGGIRAAVWAAWILERLDHLDGFRPAARLVTGASGGMVGASFWVASLCAGKNAFRTDGVTGDGLTAVARRLAFGDVPLAFLPLANEDNRGQALEDAWRVHGGPALDMTFAELRGGGWLLRQLRPEPRVRLAAGIPARAVVRAPRVTRAPHPDPRQRLRAERQPRSRGPGSRANRRGRCACEPRAARARGAHHTAGGAPRRTRVRHALS